MIGPDFDRHLSTDQALAYLAARGIQTSRRMLDQLRAQGDLPFVRARGRIRILYHPAALIAALTREENKCLKDTAATRAAIGICADPSRESLFMKALAQASQPRQKRSGSAERPRSSSVTPLAKPTP
ncbi:hypothetical protein [Yoonia sp.]|uniref:hypothetical protein n=1 Tax=Yoonia sp. TaxID=2212373 RepID=UPI0025E70360|nr:hypothetical protein [Yoonia sp.]